MAMDNVEECLSYGTGYSREEDMEATPIAVGEGMEEPFKALHASIAATNAVQTWILEMLAAMEKLVVTVQFDMTWVRDDMRGVHNVMENIADHVCELRDATTELEGLREQVRADPCAQRKCFGKGLLEAGHEYADASAEHGENDGRNECEAGHNPTSYEPGTYIEETQRVHTNVDMHINISSSPEEERAHDWGYMRRASLGLSSSPLQAKTSQHCYTCYRGGVTAVGNVVSQHSVANTGVKPVVVDGFH